MQETQEMPVWLLGSEDPLEEEMAAAPVSVPSKSDGQWSLMDYSEQGAESWLGLNNWACIRV